MSHPTYGTPTIIKKVMFKIYTAKIINMNKRAMHYSFGVNNK